MLTLCYRESVSNIYDFTSIGGGAAGIFAAIRVAEECPHSRVLVLEASQKLLSKLKVSGGGRCNVTHDCQNPREFSLNYPRGQVELISSLSRFGPNEMRAWLRANGVETKVEADGRVFPVSDKSQSIIDCFLSRANALGIEIRKGFPVTKVQRAKDRFFLSSTDDRPQVCTQSLLIASGSSRKTYALAESLGHQIQELSPSLFSFNIEDPLFKDLAGISFEKATVELRLNRKKFESSAPLLITHWGLSGPAILRTSAFAAVDLKNAEYQTEIRIDFLPERSEDRLEREFQWRRAHKPNKKLMKDSFFKLPARFWQRLLLLSGAETCTWAELSKKKQREIIRILKAYSATVHSKTTYKEEFVTAGGVRRSEINFKTMESKLCSGLYFAGEVIDIDGVTGGFNFQNCWSGANAIAENLKKVYSAAA